MTSSFGTFSAIDPVNREPDAGRTSQRAISDMGLFSRVSYQPINGIRFKPPRGKRKPT